MSLSKLSESLAGRMELHTLWPFSQGELSGVRETFPDRVFAAKLLTPEATTKRSLIDLICKGGYPEIQARKSSTRRV